MKKIKVIATLEDGRNWADYCYIILIISLLLVILGLTCFFIVCQSNDYSYIYIGFCFLLISIICFILFFKFLKKKKRIKKWLKESIALKATIIEVGKVIEFSRNNIYFLIKIKVIFKYKNKIIKKESGKINTNKKTTQGGYSRVFKRFLGKEIKIMYSEKYDQILLIKQ